ncbi:hypothetical protein C8J56DRAFT_902630 [Mycena floridula]|nr:hypothetical protein C8J56DRAFT_902630 [Mycena floridula]
MCLGLHWINAKRRERQSPVGLDRDRALDGESNNRRSFGNSFPNRLRNSDTLSETRFGSVGTHCGKGPEGLSTTRAPDEFSRAQKTRLGKASSGASQRAEGGSQIPHHETNKASNGGSQRAEGGSQRPLHDTNKVKIPVLLIGSASRAVAEERAEGGDQKSLHDINKVKILVLLIGGCQATSGGRQRAEGRSQTPLDERHAELKAQIRACCNSKSIVQFRSEQVAAIARGPVRADSCDATAF